MYTPSKIKLVATVLTTLPLATYIYAHDVPHPKVIDRTVTQQIYLPPRDEKPGPRTIMGATPNEIARLNGPPKRMRTNPFGEPNGVYWHWDSGEQCCGAYIRFNNGVVNHWNNVDDRLKVMLPE